MICVAVSDLLGEDERMPAFVAHLLAHLASEATPLKVEGDVEYLVNRNARGWVVTVFNDNGVFKPQQGLAQVDHSASVNVNISVKGMKLFEANEWTSDTKLHIQAGSRVHISIAPAGIAA